MNKSNKTFSFGNTSTLLRVFCHFSQIICYKHSFKTQRSNNKGTLISPLPSSEKGSCTGKKRICFSQLQAIGIPLGLEVTQNKSNPPKTFFMIPLIPLLKPTDKALHTNSLAAHSAKVISTRKAHSALENKKQHMHSWLFD